MNHIVTLLFLLGCFYHQVGAQITDPNEVKALQGIRKSLNDPMKYLRSWNKGDPCNSSWTGVQCFNMTQKDGYLHVRELLFLDMNLSGSLSAELGKLSYMEIMDFMWNKIRGSIPKEIGNITSLRLLLLNGNQLTGSLPEELGYLTNLDRMQIDQNYISGSLPKSFANLQKLKHLHMNNNSISGQLPPELAELPIIVHILLDNNNLSGHLPPEFSKLHKLKILQLDNNNFEGTIPASYGDMPGLLKLSLRNCSLQGPVPDLSRVPYLGYLDLSWNQLHGSIPANKLSDNITTIDLSYNNLSGDIPANFSGFPRLQKLSLENNILTGSVPSNIWQDVILNGNTVLLDFQNNVLTDISDFLDPPENVSVRLKGNPVCEHAYQLNIVQFCISQNGDRDVPESSTNPEEQCLIQSCPENYEYVRNSPVPCFCAAPLRVGYRLKSPGFSNFLPYEHQFEGYVSSGLNLDVYQLYIDSLVWEAGPRLRTDLKLFPAFNNRTNTFNESEIRRMRSLLTEWTTPDSAIFGPHELLSFTLLGPYSNVNLQSSKSGIGKGVLAVTVLGVIAGVVTVFVIITILIMKRNETKRGRLSRERHSSKSMINIDGVRDFTFKELAQATNKFDESTQIGRGGYGKVYKGVLADGTVVAVKRAVKGSLQGEKEFLTEIVLLSRVHHRNLVSLIGYCDDEGEEMLVYEFMANGTLRDHLSVISRVALSFPMRLRIALDSAKGILYLHTEADPPIFHRDIKSSNILLDSKFTAKVADFGLSKLAPVPDIKGIVPGHVSTVVKGTLGYLDPEYILTRALTDKSDVYSLGVVFLEILTGMQPISHGKNMVREVHLAHKAGTMFSLIDGRMGSYPSECIETFMALALSCCQEEPNTRPSMTDVVRELENIWFMMPESEFGPSKSVDVYPSLEISSTSVTQTKDHFSVEMSGSDLISEENIAILPR